MCLVPNGPHHSAYIRPNETEFRVTNLTIGTSYHFYLEAIFDQNIPGRNTKVLKSWILIAVTKGVGQDNRTFCPLLMLLI